ncbi:NAD-dependent epimerase/dehydratase family protein [Caballeronia sp. LZ029]|uniref:NAD-dependent epimerase/dehydratase family protein n=1 Tax=Caballeronia sp. LZ029 TaxID=3038564 RepID=UPI0028633D16|nr:NAD-dependent epimerase/dehydratase family protein [Caballeronia sp. LZ029]MDR5747305.1 NAD-dependent epimerase/dehydratase family protein [Caballeronia sp. LZ029]
MNIFITGAGGFIGGSIAAGLARDGHRVRGLIRRAEQADDLKRLNIEPVIGSLDDTDLLATEARAADAVINAASSDHRAAVETLIGALEGTNKPFLHTSGSSIVGDASGGEASDKIYSEDDLPAPTPDKAPRVAIDTLVVDAAKRGVRSAVLCNTLIYGHGAVPNATSVQLPRLERQAKKSGIVRHVGRGLNIWSNVHIDDVVDIYRLALEKSPAGTFYFVESGESQFRDMTTAMVRALDLRGPEDWPLEEAIEEWGYEMASYGLGSNSRVRSKRTREVLGWQPKRTSVIEWIEKEMVR